MNEWQPIETAPKATKVLVWGDMIGEICARMPNEKIAVAINEYGDGWYVCATDYYSVEAIPTHWMPLPAPPPE